MIYIYLCSVTSHVQMCLRLLCPLNFQASMLHWVAISSVSISVSKHLYLFYVSCEALLRHVFTAVYVKRLYFSVLSWCLMKLNGEEFYIWWVDADMHIFIKKDKQGVGGQEVSSELRAVSDTHATWFSPEYLKQSGCTGDLGLSVGVSVLLAT